MCVNKSGDIEGKSIFGLRWNWACLLFPYAHVVATRDSKMERNPLWKVMFDVGGCAAVFC